VQYFPLYFFKNNAIINISKERKRGNKMSKEKFLARYRTDFTFRAECRTKGIQVIQDNVIFFNPDGSVNHIAGAYVK
jgi:hypothetical protein